MLGEQLSQRHLSYADRLIGIVGDAGSGKSSIIKGLLPGLELVNDDDGINPMKIMQVRDLDRTFESSTYHIDMRFQLAFTQMYEVVDFVKEAIQKNRRLVIEHFDQLYPFLGMNADLIIGVGEEILVTRPNIFGPLPQDVHDIVFASVKYRRMAHTAEDLTAHILLTRYGIEEESWRFSDVRRGFVLKFREKPDINIAELEQKVKEEIAKGLSISYYDDEHISLGDTIHYCTGPRIHLMNTSEITKFQLIPEFIYDERAKDYSLVGLIGEMDGDFRGLNKLKNF